MLANRRNCSDTACAAHVDKRGSEKKNEMYVSLLRGRRHGQKTALCRNRQQIKPILPQQPSREASRVRKHPHTKRNVQELRPHQRTYHGKKVVNGVSCGNNFVVASIQIGFPRYQDPIGFLFLLFRHDGEGLASTLLSLCAPRLLFCCCRPRQFTSE